MCGIAGCIGVNDTQTVNRMLDALPLVIRKLETYDPSLVRCAVPCYFTCKLAADYFQIFRQFHPQDSILKSIGI